MTTWPRMAPRRLAMLVILPILAGAVLVGIGIQSSRFQSGQETRDACVSAWGDELVLTVTIRTEASQRLEKFETLRSEALDNIVLATIALRADPPESDDEAYNAVLLEFVVAKTKRDKVARQVAMTREDNQFPVIDC